MNLEDILKEFSAQPQFQSEFPQITPDMVIQPPPAQNSYTVIYGAPMGDYLALPQISSGTIAQLYGDYACGQKLEAYIKKKTDPTKAMQTGTTIHAFVEAFAANKSLDEFMRGYHILPATNRTKINVTIDEINAYCDALGIPRRETDTLKLPEIKDIADELKSRCNNMVTAGDYEVLKGSYKELLRIKAENDLLSLMVSEVTIYNNDLKCRPDGLVFFKDENGETCAMIISVKTISTIERSRRAAFDYCPKEAHYRHVVSAAFGIELSNVYTMFLFLETAEPYTSVLVNVSPQTAENYNAWYRQAMPDAVYRISNNKFGDAPLPITI